MPSLTSPAPTTTTRFESRARGTSSREKLDGGHRAEMHRGRRSRPKPASIAPGPTLAKPTTATGDPGDAPARPATRPPPGSDPPLHGDAAARGVVRRAEFDVDDGDVQRARDTYTGAASFLGFVPGDARRGSIGRGAFAVAARRGGRGVHHVRVCQHQRSPADRSPSPPTRARTRIPPPPSSPFASPPPWTPMTTPDAHDAPPSVSNTTTDPRTTRPTGDAF